MQNLDAAAFLRRSVIDTSTKLALEAHQLWIAGALNRKVFTLDETMFSGSNDT